MRPRTAVVFVLVVIGAAGIGVVALTDTTGGTLTVDWMSMTARPTQVNHHPIAVTQINGHAYIAAPVSAVASQPGSCAVVMLAGNGSVRWQYTINKSACAIHGIGDPAFGDYDGDGELEVLAPTTEERLYAFDAHTGQVELRVPLAAFGYSQPAIVTAHGRRTIVADFYGHVFAIRPDGTLAWNRSLNTAVVADIQVADVTGDRTPEIAIGGSDGRLVLLAPNGTLVWSRNVTTRNLLTAQVNGHSRLFVAHGHTVTALAGNGTVLWQATPGSRTAIHAVADGDGEGVREVYVGARGAVVALDARTGAVEWTTTLASESIIPAPGVGDIDGDGAPEVVAVANTGTVSVLDPRSGEVLASYHRDVKIWVHPTVADYDGDGRAEILVMYGDGRIVSLSYHSS